MSLIPEEELKRSGTLNLAPMVDFLFLVVAVFATLAVTRATLYDGDIQLVKVQAAKGDSSPTKHNEYYVVNLSINEDGQYKWITEFNEYMIGSVEAIQKELLQQQSIGLLPKECSQTKVLVHIDKEAQWKPIADLIFSVKQMGFEIHPVYDYESDSA